MASLSNLQGVYSAKEEEKKGIRCEASEESMRDNQEQNDSMRSPIQTAASHLIVIPTTMIGPAVLMRAPSGRRFAVELCERRVLRGRHRHLTIGTMGMNHVGAVRLGSVREKSGRIELRWLRVPLLITILSVAVVVWRRDRCDVELGVVGGGLTRFWGGWGGELAVEPRSIANRGGHVGGHRRRCRGRGHAWRDRHALLLWRVGSVDVGACVTSIKVRKE